MVSINIIRARVRVRSKTAFAEKLMILFTFTFWANVRMMISNWIAVTFGVCIEYIYLRWYLLIV